MGDWGFYDYRPPRPVAGGIKARSKRGDIGATWWSKRFVSALEGYYTTTSTRLARGRSYARAGQTIDLHLSPGLVESRVQGSRPSPYAVTIEVRVLTDPEWRRVEEAMAARAVFLARLLAGEMPDEIEDAFGAAKLLLFPARRGDLSTRCTCPDVANPCKHIAAVFYLLAESFDADPFRMFEWRGRGREQLVAELRALRPEASASTPEAQGAAALVPGGPAHEDTLERFWNGRPGWAEVRIEPHPTSPPDALLRELETQVLDVLGADAPSVLRPFYLAAARAARERLAPDGGEAARNPLRRRSRA